MARFVPWSSVTMHSVETQRVRLLVQLEKMLERPMIILSCIWVALVGIELVQGQERPPKAMPDQQASPGA